MPAVLHNAVVLYRRTITFSYILSTNQSRLCTSLPDRYGRKNGLVIAALPLLFGRETLPPEEHHRLL
eukprot:2549362-Pyramimonas_sp.AAC.1